MNSVGRQLGKVLAILSLTAICLPQASLAARIKHVQRTPAQVMSSGGYQQASSILPSAPLVKMPYRSWLPKKEKPRMVLLCIHALGFSSQSYDNFGRRMAASGIPTYAIDVRGFGAWMKQQDKDQLDFEACLTDVEQAVKTLHKAYPRLPVFLVGESMGGAIAIQAASRYPDQVNGLVSAVPSATERANSMAKSTMVVGFRTATNPVGSVDMTPVVVDGATNDPALRQKIEDNPLNRMELSKKELAQFEKFMKETHQAAPLVERTPALMLVAYKDKLVTPAGSVSLFEDMTTPQKMLVGDGNSGHLMLEEGQMTHEIEWILKGWLREKAAKVVLREGVASNN